MYSGTASQSLSPTAFKQLLSEDAPSSRVVAQLIRFGDGSGEVPLVVFFGEGLSPAEHQKLLDDPQDALLQTQLVDAVCKSGLACIDLLCVHAPLVEAPTWADNIRATQAALDLIERVRSVPPASISFIGVGQGAACATLFGLRSRATASIACFKARGVLSGVPRPPHLLRAFTPGLFLGLQDCDASDLWKALGRRGLHASVQTASRVVVGVQEKGRIP